MMKIKGEWDKGISGKINRCSFCSKVGISTVLKANGGTLNRSMNGTIVLI